MDNDESSIKSTITYIVKIKLHMSGNKWRYLELIEKQSKAINTMHKQDHLEYYYALHIKNLAQVHRSPPLPELPHAWGMEAKVNHGDRIAL